MVKRTEDKFAMAIEAEKSKLLREIILRSLPAGLKKEYELRAREIVAERDSGENGLPDQKALARMLAAFSKYRVTREQIEAHIGRAVSQFTGEDMVTLRGLFNALESGDLDARETFTHKENGEDQTEPLAGAPDARKELAKGQKKRAKNGEKKAPTPREPGEDGDDEPPLPY